MIFISPDGFLTWLIAFYSTDPSVTAKPNASYITIGLGGQHPFSRGTTHINSSDGLAQPVIDPQYYSFQYGMSSPKYTTIPHSDSFRWYQCFVTTDKKMMIEAVKYGIKIGSEEPLKSAIAVNPYDATWTDSFIEEFVTNFTSSEFHPG